MESSENGDLSEEEELTDVPVLDLNVSEAVELHLVKISKEAKGIKEAKG